MNILYLCREPDSWDHKEPGLFARAFRRCGVDLVCPGDRFPVNGNIQDLLGQCQQMPNMIVWLESAHALLPEGLEKVNIPTISFQSDTYAYTRHRIRWSMLFDYAVVFHPGFEAMFHNAGHPRVIAWSHAADPELFSDQQEQRTFEVGFVGRTDGTLFKNRRAVLRNLLPHFRMNDFTRFYAPEELASVYCRSKIIVNVARDDYPQDANMRVFEAMASGALLITRLPSELTSIGFEDGVHFVGYTQLDEIVGLARHYLNHESTRKRIAQTAREKILREHTYDCRVKTLMRTVEGDAGQLFAPARQWPIERVQLTQLDYYAASSCLEAAYQSLREISSKSLFGALRGASQISRALARKSVTRVRTVTSGVGLIAP
jgi:ribosomal protein S20